MHFGLDIFIEAINMDPDCLQYRLPKNISRQKEQMTKVLTGGLRVKTISLIFYMIVNSERSG